MTRMTEGRPSLRKLMTLTCAAMLCASSAFAQAAAKAAAASNTLLDFYFDTGGPVTTAWVDAVSVEIMNPGLQGLFVTFNCQTLNIVTSSSTTFNLFPNDSTEEAIGIQARLLVDGVVVPYAIGPGVLTIVNVDSQFRRLVTSSTPPTPLQTFSLVTQLGGNRSVTWIVPQTTNAEHAVTVQVRFTSSTVNIPIPYTYDAVTALVGARNLTVESVNLK
jgi:hypothetical protein